MKKSEDNNSRTKETSLAGSLFLLCYISEQSNKFMNFLTQKRFTYAIL